MKIPSLMIAAGSSGTGKTLITCGLLQILKSRGYRVVSFKCGPDYIDPMFHSRVLGTKSRNLDTFLMGEKNVRESFFRNSDGYDAAVLEGVMGYYDGLAGISTKASAYDVARTVDADVILLVNGKGMSLSVLAQIQGFLQYRPDSHIRGVILNRISPMMYDRMEKLIQDELHINVYGYVPELKNQLLESRHLGLIMPEEIKGLQKQMELLGKTLEETVKVDALLEDFQIKKKIPVDKDQVLLENKEKPVRVALARDEAFCFMYEDNLDLLRRLGVELAEFSPIHDKALPENCSGLLLYGGYPELYGEALSKNVGMRESILAALRGGMPCMAECGGFMYLQKSMKDMDGKEWPMVGFLPGGSFYTGHLSRFGYVELDGGTVFGVDVGWIPAHEFHYFDSTDCGEAFEARKPLSKRKWNCMYSSDTCLLGFPHLHYLGNPKIAERFVRICKFL